MGKEEIKKEELNKVSGGIGHKKSKVVKCGKSILDNLASTPAPYYGAPAIKPIKPELTDKPVVTQNPEQTVEPLTPVNPVKSDDSEILK